MKLTKQLALMIPAVRRLYDERNALLAERASLIQSVGQHEPHGAQAVPETPHATHTHASEYASRIQSELATYAHVVNVSDLPEIHGYWADKYVRPLMEPFGFSSGDGFYVVYLKRIAEKYRDRTIRVVTLGAGNCDLEVEIAKKLVAQGVTNFSIECLDLNEAMLQRGKQLATKGSVEPYLAFTQADINAWRPAGNYDAVIANHSLHHFLELENLFDKVRDGLRDDGYFLTHDMIGRNGHMRWPEALEVVDRFWQELPSDSYKYNHLLKRTEASYINFDCSADSFEGIRAQDILPLLMQRFDFELFVPFGNVIDIFVDRCFGHNYRLDREWDVRFIDRVQQADEELIGAGRIKPTHMVAAMTRGSGKPALHHPTHLTPAFCVRDPAH